MPMQTLQFEGVKIAMKQDRTGYILTLNVHPDEVPEALLRDFVGARYQVVMVRLNGEEQPINREAEYSRDAVRAAGILCRDPQFAQYLMDIGHIFELSESAVVAWLKEELDIQSRAELKENKQAAQKLQFVQQEYRLWKANV
jgi:uncharacterized protein YcgL (UPF0745 family)